VCCRGPARPQRPGRRPQARLATDVTLNKGRDWSTPHECLVDTTQVSQAEPASATGAAGLVGHWLNTEDRRAWARQGWSGTGYFVEDKESLGANPLRLLQQKKLLSAVEKAGLLSRAEKAGLTLSRVRPALPRPTLCLSLLRARQEGQPRAVAGVPQTYTAQPYTMDKAGLLSRAEEAGLTLSRVRPTVHSQKEG